MAERDGRTNQLKNTAISSLMNEKSFGGRFKLFELTIYSVFFLNPEKKVRYAN